MPKIVSERKKKKKKEIAIPLLPPQGFYIINPSNQSRMSSALCWLAEEKKIKKHENEKLYYFPLSTLM